MSAARRPGGARGGPSTSKSGSKRPRSQQERGEGDVRLVCPVCGRRYKTERWLDRHVAAVHTVERLPVESPTVAVERVLASLELSDRHAVAAATVRQLAAALERCEPADVAKTSKELAARMADLLDVTAPPEGDWTDEDHDS